MSRTKNMQEVSYYSITRTTMKVELILPTKTNLNTIPSTNPNTIPNTDPSTNSNPNTLTLTQGEDKF